MNTQQTHSDIQNENEKLRLENVQLKKNLEKEEFLHKALYRQWNELNIRRLAEKRELKQLESRNLFYKYAFYVILFLVAAYYFLSNSKGSDKTDASQTVSSSTPTPNQTVATSPDTLQLINVKLEERAAHPAIIEPAITEKPIIDKSLPDSVRSLIYWEGWSAYYEKLHNPYQKSLQKSEAWLAGWKQGENDAKKKSEKEDKNGW